MCFLDAYADYHKIFMHPRRKDCVCYCLWDYKRMPFGLKSAGSTYQRLVTKAFLGQLGRNVEAYIDDMVIKSLESTTLLADVRETFDSLRRYNIKLNPQKCTFGMGMIVSKRGVEANPDKICDVLYMPPPREVQFSASMEWKDHGPEPLHIQSRRSVRTRVICKN